ncbi:general stress protein [Desemzia sp. RIT804]|uniref:general stress protein n=1 Tax=Desemzia sp. RIT 804 TaxID=2810209 RepID=UPI00194F78F2|nr:general stress protein [Desemzia sp. RIT 804]MBM6615127.1 general stress protein [Desemzia sp. RIT 804]
MGKFVNGSYATIEEANQAIEELVTQGYDRNLLTLISNKEAYDRFSTSADAQINTEHAEADESMWDKVKDVFSSDDSGYEVDEEILEPYQEDIDAGKLVLLVDDFSNEAGATDFSNSTPPETSDEHTVSDPTDEDPSSIPPVLDNEDDMDKKRRNSHYTPNSNPGNARTPSISEDAVLGGESDYSYEDEVDTSIDTNLLADTDENLLPDETVDPSTPEGSLGSPASDERTGLEDSDDLIRGTRPGTHDTVIPPSSDDPSRSDK